MRSVKDLLGFITTIVVAEPRPGVRGRGYEAPTCLGGEEETGAGLVNDEKDAEDFRPYELPPLEVDGPVIDNNGGEDFVGNSG